MKTRIEQDPDSGDCFIILPEEIIEDYQLEVGDAVKWVVNEDDEIFLEFDS